MSSNPFSILARRSSLSVSEQAYQNPFLEETKMSRSESSYQDLDKTSATGIGIMRSLGGRLRRATMEGYSFKRQAKIPAADAIKLGELLPEGRLHAVPIIDLLLNSDAGKNELRQISEKLFISENIVFLIAFDNFEKAKDLKTKSIQFQKLQEILNDKNGLNSNVLAELSFGVPEQEQDLRNNLLSSCQKALQNIVFFKFKADAFRPVATKIKTDMILQLLPELNRIYKDYLPKPQAVPAQEVAPAQDVVPAQESAHTL